MSEDKLLYHITDYNNLESILKQGYLLSHNLMMENNLKHNSIAHKEIQDRRGITKVPLTPYGNLHDYVPFYFSPRSPMLYSICNHNVEGYTTGQEQIVYLVSRTDEVVKENLEFVFTDGHSIMAISNFTKDLQDLKLIDWNIIHSHYWHDTEENPDRKRRKQAEFLVYKSLPINRLLGFAVKNAVMKQKVQALINKYNFNKQVGIRNGWYF